MQPQAPRPGVVPLRPLGVGELLDGAFTTIRRYPAATLGVSAVVMLVVEAIHVITTYAVVNRAADNSTATGTGVASGIDLFVTLIVTALLPGLLAAVVGEGVLGRPMNAQAALRRTRASFWRLLGATLLVGLISGLIGAAGAIPGLIIIFAGATVAGVVILVVGVLVTGVFAFYVAVTLTFTTTALMLERQGIIAAMRRSRILVKNSWWRIFGITLLTGIMAATLNAILALPFAAAGAGFSVFSGHPAEQYEFGPLLLSSIGTFIGSTLSRPFSAAVTALLYIDRRMRAEGLDLTLQQTAATQPQ